MNQAVAIDPAEHPSDQEEGCLFCQFTDRSLNRVLEETAHFYARWDNYPAAKGHVEIAPKKHMLSFFDLNPDDLKEMYGLMSVVKSRLEEKYQPNGYTIGVNDGRAAGRTVDHLHIHLIPRYTGDVTDPRGGVRRILPNCDPDSWSSPGRA
ncbi:HIT family protein [Amycolatopsis samaneae]|uniref:HIT family protein n=1 Tax=Amycolatopsis samaneae TaxID=664691 RepID=A0ABW5GDJ8_9PSEU